MTESENNASSSLLYHLLQLNYFNSKTLALLFCCPSPPRIDRSIECSPCAHTQRVLSGWTLMSPGLSKGSSRCCSCSEYLACRSGRPIESIPGSCPCTIPRQADLVYIELEFYVSTPNPPYRSTLRHRAPQCLSLVDSSPSSFILSSLSPRVPLKGPRSALGRQTISQQAQSLSVSEWIHTDSGQSLPIPTRHKQCSSHLI